MIDDESKSQYRWDPLLKEWIIYAPARNKRPFQGKNFNNEKKKDEKNKEKREKITKTWTCPFCPDAPEGSGDWTVKLLPNRFAALSENEFPFITKPTVSYSKSAPNAGQCNVVLYSKDHKASFGTLEHDNIVQLIKLWGNTFNEIKKNPEMRYIFIMENRGAEIGCSMSHPHGQIYSFPIIPPKIEREFSSFKESYKDGKCIMCQIVDEELADGSRIIEKNNSFIAEIPYYAHWPFEIHIVPLKHISNVADLDEDQINDLASIMKNIVRRYDLLWNSQDKKPSGEDVAQKCSPDNNHNDKNNNKIGNKDENKSSKNDSKDNIDNIKKGSPFMPYIMAMHNSPVNIDGKEKWHFHIEYYTPYRGPGKWKYLAGVELGTFTFLSDNLPKTNAKILRDYRGL